MHYERHERPSGCSRVPRKRRWGDDSTKVHFTGPGGPPQLLLSPNEGRETCRQVSAGQRTSKLAKQWLADHGISVFPYPPSSPNLNPIEPVWHELKKLKQALPQIPTTIQKLIQAIHNAWEVLEIPNIDKYVDTMPERVQAILNARGVISDFD